MLTRESALKLAEDEVAKFSRESRLDLVVLDEHSIEFDGGWVFHWGLRSPDPEDPLVGHSPLVIFQDGTIRETPTGWWTVAQKLDWIRTHPARPV
jgi:hypothetical protein